MNKIIMFLSLLFFTACKNSTEAKKPLIKLNNEIINLGVLSPADTVRKSFPVYNSGTDTLFITKVGVSCGCTNGHSDKLYVLPGDSANIFFTYSPANDIDSVQKSLNVKNNSAEPFKLVYLRAFVRR